MTDTARQARAGRVPLVIPGAILAAWTVAIVAQASGARGLVDHDALMEGGPERAALLIFLAGWILMVTAMMLPSTVPMVRLFTLMSARQPQAGKVQAAFMGGYAVVWLGFGTVAFVGDLLLHEVVAAVPWLDARPWLVTGAALAGAGAFQFTDLKDRCLESCRHPAAFLLPRYRRGVDVAFRLGRSHGIFCLGCCWALMLLMFAAGLADLRWMAALGALMTYEKVGRHGKGAAQVAGVVLLAWSALVIVQAGP